MKTLVTITTLHVHFDPELPKCISTLATHSMDNKELPFFGFQSDSIGLLYDQTYDLEVLSQLNMNVEKYLTFFLVYHKTHIFPSESTCTAMLQVRDANE
jgi:hypothetical protein